MCLGGKSSPFTTHNLVVLMTDDLCNTFRPRDGFHECRVVPMSGVGVRIKMRTDLKSGLASKSKAETHKAQ